MCLGKIARSEGEKRRINTPDDTGAVIPVIVKFANTSRERSRLRARGSLEIIRGER